MIKVVSGDLFESSADLICHQVNCQGVMNTGVAFSVKQKYPNVFEKYKIFCEKNKGDLLGKVLYVKCADGKIICNLFAQDNFGYDGNCYTSYEALKNCFESIKKYATEKEEIAMPYLMGCHRGGGDWNTVYKMLEECFGNHNLVLYKKEG